MQSDPPPRCVVGRCSFGNSFDGGGVAGRANQWFLVPIRRDQNQRFRCAILLDAPASHGRPFRQGWYCKHAPRLYG